MPNTGDATGSFDTGKALQDIYRAFQDNGVPILGKAIVQVTGGDPPTVHVSVNLQDGQPVVTDPNTLSEGDSLPPFNGILDIDLTQFNNSVGGYSWVASGTVTRSDHSQSTGTSTPGTGGLSSMDLNDPDKRDQWNDSLPRDAYEAIERVKRKLGIHGGLVRAALRPTLASRLRRVGRARAALIGAVAGGAVGALGGLAFAAPVTAPTVPMAAVTESHPGPAAPAAPAFNTLNLNLGGTVNMTAVPPVCAGWPQSGSYHLDVQASGGGFTMSIDKATPATGTLGADGSYSAQNQFYQATGRLQASGRATGTIRYGLGSSGENCGYTTDVSFGSLPGVTPPPPPLAGVPVTGELIEGGDQGGGPNPLLWIMVALFGGGAAGGALSGLDCDGEGELDPSLFQAIGADDPTKDVVPVAGDSSGPPPDEVM